MMTGNGEKTSPAPTLTAAAPHQLHDHQHGANHQPREFQETSLQQKPLPAPPSFAFQEYHLHNIMTTASLASHMNSNHKFPVKPHRTGPSVFRQMLPIALCLISFATVLSVLIIYMDTTEIRHQQFRLNMSRDYDLLGVSQDNPALISYLREVHMRKYSNTPFFTNDENEENASLNFTGRKDLTPQMAQFVAQLLGPKANGGVFLQSLTGSADTLMMAPWLSETLNWGGVIVEPDPRKYFNYRKQNIKRSDVEVVHACISPNEYPKEVTLHEESEVKINSILDEETEWFHSRVKCFPLFTIMLAVNRTQIDLLSLGCHGQELQILQTIPFDRVHFEVISLHFAHQEDQEPSYMQNVTKFLFSKGYKFMKRMQHNYFFKFNRLIKTL